MSNRLPQLAAQHYVIGQPYRNEESYDTTTHRPHVRMWVTGAPKLGAIRSACDLGLAALRAAATEDP